MSEVMNVGVMNVGQSIAIYMKVFLHMANLKCTLLLRNLCCFDAIYAFLCGTKSNLNIMSVLFSFLPFPLNFLNPSLLDP